MATQTDTMDRLLATLGEARQNGAFAGRAAGYPWQVASVATQSRPRSWHARLWKVGPLAAAAAVAVLFVGPNWFSKEGSPVVQNDPSAMTTPDERPETLNNEAATTPSGLEFDFNGDGVVNGDDNSGFIERVQRGEIIDRDEFIRRQLNG